jgi:hypothetical protein
MACVIVSTWMPRSPQHLREVAGLLDKAEVNASDVVLDGDLRFNAESNECLKANVSFTPYGLFSFTVECDVVLGEAEIQGLTGKVKQLLLEDILKIIQPITYRQITGKIMPIRWEATVLDDPAEAEAAGYHAYVKLASGYVEDMVSIFGGIYKEMVDAESKMEDADFTVLKETMLTTEEIKKGCVERYGKLKQASNNMWHANKAYTQACKDAALAAVSESMGVPEGFTALEYDFGYVMPLWSDVLIKNLENLNFMVSARLSMQQSVETQKEEREMKLLQGIFLVGVITSIIALGAMPGASITLYNPEGALVAEGELVSFQLRELLLYGVIAILISVSFFALFNYAYMRINKNRNK